MICVRVYYLIAELNSAQVKTNKATLAFSRKMSVTPVQNLCGNAVYLPISALPKVSQK